MHLNIVPATFLDRPGLVYKRKIACRRFCVDLHRITFFRARLEYQVHGVFLKSQRGYFSAVVILQVVYAPTNAEAGAAEITFIADQISFDSLHPRVNEGIGQSIDRSLIVTVVEAMGKGRITATV